MKHSARIKRLSEKIRPQFKCIVLHQDAGADQIKHESGLTFESEEAAREHFKDAHVVVIQFV